MGEIKAVFFDLDGTLLDSMWVWSRIDEEFLARRGLTVPADYVETVGTLNALEAARYTIGRFGLEEKPEAITAEWYDMAIGHYRRDVPLKPGAGAYLEALKAQGLLLATATALQDDLALPALERTGILDLFDARFSTDTAGRSKAHPDIFLQGARHLGVAPAQCALFEDLLPCMRGGKAAGLRVYGVHDDRAGATEAEILQVADGYIYSFAEAPRPLV